MLDQLYQRTVETLTLRKASFCPLCLISCAREQWKHLPWGRPLAVHYAWSAVPEQWKHLPWGRPLSVHYACWSVGVLTPRKASFCSLCLLISGSAYPEEGLFLFIMLVDQLYQEGGTVSTGRLVRAAPVFITLVVAVQRFQDWPDLWTQQYVSESVCLHLSSQLHSQFLCSL